MLKCLLFLFALACIAPVSGQIMRSEKKFFPEEELVLNTPSFETKRFMRYPELMAFLETCQAEMAMSKLETIGETQKGRAIPVMRFTNPDVTDPVRVLYIGGVHGNEPAGTEGLLLFIDSLCRRGKYSDLLDRIDLAIVPLLNIDGYLHQDRESHNNLDINRDFTKYATPEAKALRRYMATFDPHVTFDFHEYSPYRLDYYDLMDQGVTSRFDAMLLYSGNLNVDPAIRAYSEERLAADVQARLQGHGRVVRPYVKSTKLRGRIHLDEGGNSPRSTSNAFALSNAVSLLLEVRGAGMGRVSLKRRVMTSYLAALQGLQTVYKDRETILNSVEGATARTLSGASPVVVKRDRGRSSEVFPFIDLRRNEAVALSMSVRSSIDGATPALTRDRPAAYIVTANLARVQEILTVIGAEFSVLPDDATMLVEAYGNVAIDRASNRYEKTRPTSVAVEVEQPTQQLLPAGSLRIPTGQKTGNLLAELFEPDAVNSLIHFQVISVDNGVIPIYRLPNE